MLPQHLWVGKHWLLALVFIWIAKISLSLYPNLSLKSEQSTQTLIPYLMRAKIKLLALENLMNLDSTAGISSELIRCRPNLRMG